MVPMSRTTARALVTVVGIWAGVGGAVAAVMLARAWHHSGLLTLKQAYWAGFGVVGVAVGVGALLLVGAELLVSDRRPVEHDR